MGGKDDQPTTKSTGYVHIHAKRGIILVNNLSPVVIMKKIKLGPSDASGFTSVTDFLPELTGAEENQDLESQQVRREGAGKTQPVQNEEVSFIDTLTQDQLNDHVQKCLEMSSENKINLKNAFALKLIDCFAFLQKKKDFSAMACTLDAGTKIYSCRVDALHQQVVKLADVVVMNTGKKRADNEGKDGETLPKTFVAKDQRKARKNKLIASSESLTRQMKGKDPKDKYLRFEALPGAILSGARRDAIDLSLSLERYSPFWPNWENYKPLKAEGKVSLPDIKIFRENPQTDILEIPLRFPEPDPPQTDLELDLGEANDAEANPIFEEENLFSVDIDSIADIPVSQSSRCNSGNNSVTSDKGTNENIRSRSCDGEADVVLTAMNRLEEEAKATGAVNRAPNRIDALKILFDFSSEYNYLKVTNCNYWAGPEFWKRPQQLNERVKEKRKVSKKKKEPTTINYDFKDLNERLLLLSKTSSCLSERIVRSWQKKKTTLPRDLKVDSSWFLHLFHVENCGGKLKDPIDSQKIENFVDVSDSLNCDEEVADNSLPTDPLSSDHEDTSGSQDPLNATFYEAASGQSVNSEPRDPLNSTFYDAGPSNNQLGKIIRVEVASSTTSDFGESSMVPIPKMVKVDPIKYSTRPIRLNMQHLKQGMLEVINEEIKKDATKPEVKFRDVLRSLPRKLERRTREDLSTAIAFTALLTLANENSLQLEKCNDGDFLVRF